MDDKTTIQEIVEQLKNLSSDQHQKVSDFAQELSGELPEGVPLRDLLKFVGAFPQEDLEQMKQAIEEG